MVYRPIEAADNEGHQFSKGKRHTSTEKGWVLGSKPVLRTRHLGEPSRWWMHWTHHHHSPQTLL